MAEPLIWLPLNGDLRNNGLNGITVDVATTTTFATNGKMGKALSGGKIRIPASYASQIFNNDAMTIAFWYNNNGNTSNHAICGFQGNTEGDSSAVRSYDFFNYPTANDFHYSMGTLGGGTITGIIPDNTWVHFCIRWDGTNLKIYINGELQVTRTGSSSFTFDKSYYISFGHTQMLNDFRIYDTALSDYEIKLLSQGLVLHYPLDRNGLSAPNLVASITSGGCTAVFGYIMTIDNSQNKDTYFRIVPTETLVAGTEYTLSMYCTGFPTDDNYVRFGMVSQSSGKDITLKNGVCFATFTLDSDITTSSNLLVDDIARGSSGLTLVIVTNIKLEKGNKPSPWIPPDSVLGNNANDTIVYDTSGFGNNGTATNVTYDGDTARYTASSVFDGDASVIIIPNIYTTSVKNPQMSFAFWMKRDNYTDGINHYIYNDICQIYTYSTYKLRITWKHMTDDSSANNTWECGLTVPADEWHHIVYTFDGGVMKIYYDGKYYNISDRSSTGQYMGSFNYTAIASAYSGTTKYFYGGSLSDLRIYSTCLDEAEIKDLFEASAKVHRDGTMYAYSYVEV